MTSVEIERVATFLYQQLGKYRDPRKEIEANLKYAMGLNEKPGGIVILCKSKDDIIGAVVMNKTNMHGYIAQNILVYIAVHENFRGKGIGKRLMQHTIKYSAGDIALYVEPENPARDLYQKLGFQNKYLEMRYLRSN